MWNQDDARNDRVRPTQPADISAGRPKSEADAIISQLGRSVSIKGDITSSEDLTIDGQVDGRIELPGHMLTVGPNATVCADITAKVVMVFGSVLGSVTAHDRIEVRRSGSVEGTMVCTRLLVQDGAILNGKVETRGERRQPRVAAESPAQVLAPVA